MKYMGGGRTCCALALLLMVFVSGCSGSGQVLFDRPATSLDRGASVWLSPTEDWVDPGTSSSRPDVGTLRYLADGIAESLDQHQCFNRVERGPEPSRAVRYTLTSAVVRFQRGNQVARFVGWPLRGDADIWVSVILREAATGDILMSAVFREKVTSGLQGNDAALRSVAKRIAREVKKCTS